LNAWAAPATVSRCGRIEQEILNRKYSVKRWVGNYVANPTARPGDFFRELLMPL